MDNKKLEYNLSITMRAILNYEKLSGQSYAVFNLTAENALMLIYSILISHPENKITETYENLKPFLSNDKILSPLVQALQKEIAFMNQFENKDSGNDITVTDNENNPKKKSEIFVKDIIPILVSDCGLDINFVMDDMKYTDVPMYLNYREQKHRNQMEEQRLFTFLNTLPHLDPKKTKGMTPEKWLPYPWEKEAKVKDFKKNQKDIERQLKKLGILKDKEDKENNTPSE